MKVTHRAPADASAPAQPVAPVAPADATANQVPRLACCCRLSELLPLVRQLHDAARDARQAGEQPGVAA